MKSVAAIWLAEQCGRIPRVSRGIVVRVTPAGTTQEAAHWPQGCGPERALQALANAALTGRDPLVDERPAGPGPGSTRVAVPFASARLRGAVAIEVAHLKASEAQPLVEELRTGIAWLEVLTSRETARGPAATILELIGAALDQPERRAAADAVATELARHLECERVSIGFPRKGRMKVEALSHSARFDARAGLIRDLGSVMDEACDQDAMVVHPPVPGVGPRVALEHERLVREQGAGAVCTVPMVVADRIVGAISFERPAERSFDPTSCKLCEDATVFLAPLLELRRAAEAPLRSRIRELFRAQLARLLDRERPALGMAAVALVAVIGFLAFARGDHRVVADATLEGRVQRAIVAGIDGYVAEVNARAGDVVRQGDVLARLDGRDLLLERRKWLARREELRKQHREALAQHDRTQVNILGARIAQAEAELALLDTNLGRTRLVAPFDGVVVRGDLSQSLGSPVGKGDVLYEIAPLDGYRTILRVDERDIAHVAPRQRGELALSAMPGDPRTLTVERITPVSRAEGGRNTFRVEARLDAPSAALRPGMEGVAKIEVGRRQLLWIWTHRLLDALRLLAWTWWR